MSKRLFFSLFTALSCGPYVWAGEVQFPAGNAAWLVEITPLSKDAATPKSQRPYVTKIEVTQSPEYRRSVCRWSNGAATETWRAVGSSVVAVEWIGNKEIYVIPANDKDSGMLVNFDESSFRWITRDFSKGSALYRSRKCLRYEGMVSKGTEETIEYNQPASHPMRPVKHEAWLDEETHFPVALDDSAELIVFTFIKPPFGSIPLTPPKRFLDRLQYYQRVMTGPKPLFPRAQ